MNENCDINEPSNRTKYTYDLNGNLSTKTDARNITIAYSYDNLNRLTGKAYSDGTPTVTLGYDFNPNLGGSNYVGRLTGTAVSSNSYALYSRTMIGYDAMGRPQGYIACTNNTWVCTVNQVPIDMAWYLYDLAGNTAELITAFVASDTQAPVTGRTFTYDGAGRLSSVIAGEGNGEVNSFTTLLSGAVYDAAGQMTSANLAIDPNTQQAEFSLSRGYDHRLRVLSETDTSQSQGPIYNYSIPSPPTSTTGYAANGNVLSFTDSVIGGWSVSANGAPCYDSVNRITCGSSSSGPYATAGLTWSYDPWGNRTAQSVSGSPAAPVPTSYWANYGTNNQVSSASNSPAGYSYDAAGNLLSDGSNEYAYDGEGRLCAMYNSLTTTVTIYLYDASGYRVVKRTVSGQSLPLTSAACNYYAAILNGFSPAELYVVGLDGTALDEVDQNGNLLHSNVNANGQLLATYTPSLSNWTYSFNDWLGTKRVVAKSDGTVLETCLGLPFGDGLDCQGGTDPSEQHFTGKELDTESGNDYFGARYYASSMGRWISPDRLNLTDDRVLNPANTLNKYAYGGNNPLKYTDPDGKDITVFYENSLLSPPGHIMFVAENQQTGDAAAMSWGPVHDSEYGFTALGGTVNSTKTFGFPQTTDELKAQYSSLTIETSPEDAQEIINFIRQLSTSTNPYTLYGAGSTNCTTVCRNALKAMGILPSGDKSWTPAGLWADLFARYSPSYWMNPFAEFFPARGADYGNRPSNYDPFALMSLLMKSNSDNSSVTTQQGPGTADPCTATDTPDGCQ